ncbi:cyclase family protein [Haloarcula onubensis]|uniref:Cyclase family protein n=1 Tax=Haloarcula onubensis TaxID=2950539 RepID=A0ABU2FMQ4_9EURY|nr:cyclase family protein [Halomicroarcula sp. S3CR25-11]MDS0282042.1 cyclase family protein [Halomicroarcula sp. S3CR25-11]
MPLADLSHPIESGMPVFPGDPPVSVDAHATIDADGYRVSSLSCGSHTGTHVDAPSHTEPDGPPLDALPVSRFVRDAVRVDLRHLSAREAIRPADLPTVEAGVVVLRTGWDRHWGEPAYLDHPYLTPAAARHCVDHGYDVAIDALNVDPTPIVGTGGSGDPHGTDGAGGSGDPHGTDGAGGSGDPHATDDHPVEGVPAHHELLGNDRLVAENLTNLAAVPERFELTALPLAIADGDGAPMRALARWD